MKKMNILAIGSHPDDVEFGCGGALTKYADKGHSIFLLIMTEGGMGGATSIRKSEQQASNEIMGVKNIFWGGYQDTHIQVNKEVISKIEETVNDVKPDFIFCHYPDDTHQDHRHLTQAVVSATRNIKNVLFYEGPTSQDFYPQIFIDISETLNRKLRALKAHQSQVTKTNIEDLSIVELARSTANFRGTQGRVKFAEAFSSLRLFINI